MFRLCHQDMTVLTTVLIYTLCMQKQNFHNYPESSQRELCLEFLIYLIVSNKDFFTEDGFSDISLFFQNHHAGWWLRLGI